MSGRPEGATRLARALRTGHAHLAACLDDLPGVAPRDVHATRVAARRLRSLLKTFEPLLAGAVARDEYRIDLKRAADALAELRRIDVIASLGPLAGQSFAAALARERTAAERRLRRRLRQPRLAGSVARLRRRRSAAALGLARGASSGQLLRRVRKAWRRVAAAAERPVATLQARHELRIRLKHCRYSLEIVADIQPALASRLTRRLRATQQLLGDERDVAEAREWLRQARGVPAASRKRADRRLQQQTRDALRALPRVVDRLQRDGARWEAAISQIIHPESPGPAPR